jgi:hypothetical protein
MMTEPPRWEVMGVGLLDDDDVFLARDVMQAGLETAEREAGSRP